MHKVWEKRGGVKIEIMDFIRGVKIRILWLNIHPWYSMVLFGTICYSMVLYGTAWYCMVLYGTVCYCVLGAVFIEVPVPANIYSFSQFVSQSIGHLVSQVGWTLHLSGCRVSLSDLSLSGNSLRSVSYVKWID